MVAVQCNAVGQNAVGQMGQCGGVGRWGWGWAWTQAEVASVASPLCPWERAVGV